MKILILILILLIIVAFVMESKICIPYFVIGSSEKNLGHDEELLGLKKYMKCLFNHINKMTGLSDKVLEGVFVKWMFNTNMQLGLNDDLIPISNIIVEADIKFLCQKYGKKYPPHNKVSKTFKYNCPPIESSIGPVKLIPLPTLHKKGKGYNIFVSETENINLTMRQYERLKSLSIHKDDESVFLHDVYYLLNVYNTLGGLNNLASVPIDWCAGAIELFGSPLNTQYDYCSAFPFEARLFGSLGSFFNYDLASDQIYIANPPFDEIIMEMMVHRLISQFYDTPRITVIIILPVWDPESQDKMKIKNYKTPFIAYDLLKQQDNYFKHDELMDRQIYQFFDYNKDQYVPLSNFHMILFSNVPTSDQKVDIQLLKDEWKEKTKQN